MRPLIRYFAFREQYCSAFSGEWKVQIRLPAMEEDNGNENILAIHDKISDRQVSQGTLKLEAVRGELLKSKEFCAAASHPLHITDKPRGFLPIPYWSVVSPFASRSSCSIAICAAYMTKLQLLVKVPLTPTSVLTHGVCLACVFLSVSCIHFS
jgi:hypothetical protein